MWKLLRNLLLAGVLVAGALKLLAWYEVGQDAQRIAAALAPYAQVRYDSISAGLDGSVGLSNVSVAVKRDKTVETYSADHVVLESPGVFWLLKHSLFDDSTLPPHFGVSIQGLKIPPTPWLDQRWFDPVTMVPFETAGCAAAAFSAADYRKMDVAPGDTRQHIDYRYDADTHTLDATLTLAATGISTVTIDGELRPFDPKAVQSLDVLKKTHLEQLALTYSDTGYLKRRNQFCAQRGSLGPAQFVGQHIAAVQGLLQQHGVELGPELLKLYRHLMESGGQASVLSLPSSNFAIGSWLNSTPEDKLRQLNVTARYGDSPPVMFRLNFPAPPQPAEPTEAVADATVPATGPNTAAATASPVATDAQTAPKLPPVQPTAPATVPAAASPATNPATTAQAPVKPPSPPAASPVVAVPASVPPARVADAPITDPAAQKPPPPPVRTPPPPEARPHTANGLEEVDRAEAKLGPLPKRGPAQATPDFAPSAPPPPAGSTLALVWKPTIERLPAPTPERPDFDLVEFASLNGYRGRFVRLVEDGGKKVEGYVVSADEAEVQLRVRARGAGAAQFAVPKALIQQIQLVRK